MLDQYHGERPHIVFTSPLQCLSCPKSVGERIIVHAESEWLADLAKYIADEFRPQGYTIYTHTVPYFVLWFMSFFSRKMVLTGFLDKIGKKLYVDNRKV